LLFADALPFLYSFMVAAELDAFLNQLGLFMAKRRRRERPFSPIA
jgi:hypothetical protein